MAGQSEYGVRSALRPLGEAGRAGRSRLGVGGDVLEAEAEPGAAREQRAQLLQRSVPLTCRQS